MNDTQYGIFNNRGEKIAETDSPENAALIRDALNAHTEGLGTATSFAASDPPPCRGLIAPAFVDSLNAL